MCLRLTEPTPSDPALCLRMTMTSVQAWKDPEGWQH